MRSRCRAEHGDAGTVTAEFAVALPAVVLVLAACLGGLRLGTEQLRATDAAALAARAAARGDAPPLIGAAARADGGSTATIGRSGDRVCATVQRQVPLLGLVIPVRATACALAAPVP